MNFQEQSDYFARPIIRINKNFVYNGKKYPFDFNLIKSTSDYFNKNKESFDSNDIEISIDKFELTDDVILNFIKCCQNENFQINDSNVNALHQLSVQYEVPELIKYTEFYHKENQFRLNYQKILHKIQDNKTKINELIELAKNSDERRQLINSKINKIEETISTLKVEIDEIKSEQTIFKMNYKDCLNENSQNTQLQRKLQDPQPSQVSKPTQVPQLALTPNVPQDLQSFQINSITSYCTQEVAGKKYIKQRYFKCNTCWPPVYKQGKFICEHCAKNCHRGHKIQFVKEDYMFCSCFLKCCNCKPPTRYLQCISQITNNEPNDLLMYKCIDCGVDYICQNCAITLHPDHKLELSQNPDADQRGSLNIPKGQCFYYK